MEKAHFLCALAYVSIILITPFSVWAYEENFDTGKAEGWVDASAGKSWEAEKDQYHQPDAGPVNVFACYAIDDKKWQDYTFEVQIKPISVSNYAGVLFRVKDAGAGGTSWATGDFLTGLSESAEIIVNSGMRLLAQQSMIQPVIRSNQESGMMSKS